MARLAHSPLVLLALPLPRRFAQEKESATGDVYPSPCSRLASLTMTLPSAYSEGRATNTRSPPIQEGTPHDAYSRHGGYSTPRPPLDRRLPSPLTNPEVRLSTCITYHTAHQCNTPAPYRMALQLERTRAASSVCLLPRLLPRLRGRAWPLPLGPTT